MTLPSAQSVPMGQVQQGPLHPGSFAVSCSSGARKKRGEQAHEEILVAPELPSVVVRSGQRRQSVMRCADMLGLYVFSEQGISVSAEHQWPELQTLHSTAPVAFAKLPGLQGRQAEEPWLLAKVPLEHATGAAEPMPLKKPGRVLMHCSLRRKSVRLL